MAKTLPFVRIQSSKNIQVTCGLQNLDVTNKDAHVPDRLKVNALWPKATLLIREGTGVYPSEIVDWPTVKALANDKIITIGQFLEKAETTEEEHVKTKLEEGLNEIKENQEAVKASLADIAK